MRVIQRAVELGVRLVPLVQPPDPPLGLDPRDGPHRVWTRQPVHGREGAPLGVQRVIPDDQRVRPAAGGAPGDHAERGGGPASQLLADGDEVRGPKLASRTGNDQPTRELLALVVDGAPEVHLALLALAHEALELLLELW